MTTVIHDPSGMLVGIFMFASPLIFLFWYFLFYVMYEYKNSDLYNSYEATEESYAKREKMLKKRREGYIENE